MSLQQLDLIIADVQACFGSWTAETPMPQMRDEWDALSSTVPSAVGAQITAVDAGGVRAHWVVAPGASDEHVVMYQHGGGYAFGSLRSHNALVQQLSLAAKARVLFVDYRLAPEHPFPAAVEDTAAAYHWLLGQGYTPQKIALAGDSAGGGLSLATLLSLKRSGTSLPACATLFSPWVDMEGSGATVVSKAAEDPMVQKANLDQLAAMYVGQGNLRDPLASPLHGDLSGFPPLLIHAGTREALLDDALRISARAKREGVEVELEIFERLIHAFQIFCTRLDEAREAIDHAGRFIARHLG